MSKRGFFWPALTALIALFTVPAGAAALATPVNSATLGSGAAATGPTVTVSETTRLHSVPHAYLGFSIDPANLCYIVQLAQANPAFVQLFRDIGPGTFRVGGNTGDAKATWSATASSPTCVWNALVVTPPLVRQFFAFAQKVGYKVMWQAPLANGQYAKDAAEAAYVSSYATTLPAPNPLLSIEFGNEPNYYTNARTQYARYIAAWGTVYQDYQAAGGTAPVTGPATLGATWYAKPFLIADASRILALTEHWYVASAKTSPTCLSLLSSPSQTTVSSMVSQASLYGLPAIDNETNTYTSQGQPGVSNAYCSALWAAMYSLNGLAAGLHGMYFHGVANYPPGNSDGKKQVYTPVNTDGTPAPEFYGLLMTARMTRAGGSQVSAQTANVTGLGAYAVTGSDHRLRVALINGSSTSITVITQTALAYAKASEISLTAPALNSLAGVTLGGTSVAADGSWTPNPQPVTVNGTTSTINIPSYTGVIVTYSS